MPNINEIVLILAGFQYATSLYLNMGYYHIRLIKNASNLCTIILPWGKYHFKRLPMVIASSWTFTNIIRMTYLMSFNLYLST